jgi:hypothetical protein
MRQWLSLRVYVHVCTAVHTPVCRYVCARVCEFTHTQCLLVSACSPACAYSCVHTCSSVHCFLLKARGLTRLSPCCLPCTRSRTWRSSHTAAHTSLEHGSDLGHVQCPVLVECLLWPCRL